MKVGLYHIDQHNRALGDQLVDGLNEAHFKLISPSVKSERTNIIVFSFKDEDKNSHLFEFLKSEGFHLALWRNKLRVSPHIYNTSQEIERLGEALERYATS